jgi:hypothetical protein
MSRHLLACAVIALLTSPPCARAYTAIGASIEWLCRFSPVVVRCKVVSVDREKVECEAVEILKGKAGKNERFKFDEHSKPMRKGDEVLLFLARERGRLGAANWVNLGRPGTRGVTGTAYTKKGEVLGNKAAILGLVRDRLKRKETHAGSGRFAGVENGLYINAPGDAAMALYAGSATMLLVPPDPEFKKEMLARYRERRRERAKEKGKLARKVWAEDLSDDVAAARALYALSFFGGEEVIKLLEKGLDDPRHTEVALMAMPGIGFKGARCQLHPVREAAYEALLALGRKPARPRHHCPHFRVSSNGYGFLDARSGVHVNFELPEP